ncbi:MAG: hypothetical protein V3S98_09975 [Dehalococcoidia bacterium]
MPPAGIVDALRKFHRLLRPGGTLLDAHPTTVSPSLEVVASNGKHPLGDLVYADTFVSTIANAKDALSKLVAEGLFVREQAAEYEAAIHLDSYPIWETYWEEQGSYYVEPDDDTLKAIQELMGTGEAELVLKDRIEATPYRRPP